jgi:hypothetical protein
MKKLIEKVAKETLTFSKINLNRARDLWRNRIYRLPDSNSILDNARSYRDYFNHWNTGSNIRFITNVAFWGME